MRDPSNVLWVYTILLVAGGVMGLIKGGSVMSLYVSVAFAIPLVLCNLGILPFAYSTWILLALLAVFAWRLTQSKKFMPGGLMLILTAVALALPHLLK